MHSIQEQLILHEGLRLKAYRDTLNNWTVGVGYNLTGRGTGFLRRVLNRPFPASLSAITFTRVDAMTVLDADIVRVEAAVRRAWPFYAQLEPVRQKVILDMAFNLGNRAKTFVKTRQAIEKRDWTTAVSQLYRSKWAHQVGDGEGGRFDRADRLVGMLLTGQDYAA